MIHFFNSLIFFVILFIPAFLVHADDIPDDHHPVERCVMINNINDFPDIFLIGYYTGVMVDYEAYFISTETCLTKGYKFDTFYIYWTTKEYAGSIDIESLYIDNTINDPNIHLLSDEIEPSGGYVSNDSKKTSETLIYELSYNENTSNYSLSLISTTNNSGNNNDDDDSDICFIDAIRK